MKKQTVLLTVAAVAALTLGAVTLRAADQARGRWAERLAELGVTDTQREQLRAVLQAHLPEVEPLVKQLVTERRALRDRIRTEPVNESAIRAQAARVAAVEADLAVARARIAADLRPLLTPAQVEKLHEWKSEVEDRVDFALSRIAKHLAGD